MKKIFQQNSSFKLTGHSYWEIFLLLQGMEREKTEHGGWRFAMEYQGYQIAFESGKEQRKPYFHVWGVGKQQQALGEISVSLCPGQEEEIHVPDSLMKQEEVMQFQKIWSAAVYLIEGRN